MLDWYTVLVGLLGLAALIVHGANYMALKTNGPVHERALRLARRWWMVTLLLTVLATVATFWLRPALLGSFAARPWGAVLPALAIITLAVLGLFVHQGRDALSFAASGAFVLSMLGSTAFVVYPNVLPAIDPSRSLTVDNAASTSYALTVGLVWWSIALVLAVVYFIVIYNLFRGKVQVSEEGY